MTALAWGFAAAFACVPVTALICRALDAADAERCRFANVTDSDMEDE